MSKELKFEFNDYIIAIDEPYEKDCGYVAIGKKDTKDNINIWFKSFNEQTVDFYIELQKHITDLEAKLAEKQSRIQELNDLYEDLLCAKGTEHELKQAKEDVEMLNERNLCLYSVLYGVLERQSCKDIPSLIEQLTNLHLNKCSHWYKNNRVCDELEQQLAEKEKEIEEYKKHIRFKGREITKLKRADQDKISFCIEKLEKVKWFVEEIDFNYGDDKRIDRFAVMNEIDDQIEQLTHQHEDKGEKYE